MNADITPAVAASIAMAYALGAAKQARLAASVAEGAHKYAKDRSRDAEEAAEAARLAWDRAKQAMMVLRKHLAEE